MTDSPLTEADALEIEAQAIAEKHGYDTAALRFNRDRYQFGTLAHTRVAPHYRALYSRALAIACERPEMLQAAE